MKTNKKLEPVDLAAVVKTWAGRLRSSGTTQEKASEDTGISQGQVSQFLRGMNSPNIRYFEKFENYLRRLGV